MHENGLNIFNDLINCKKKKKIQTEHLTFIIMHFEIIFRLNGSMSCASICLHTFFFMYGNFRLLCVI